jgi:hypothetical protein
MARREASEVRRLCVALCARRRGVPERRIGGQFRKLVLAAMQPVPFVTVSARSMRIPIAVKVIG